MLKVPQRDTEKNAAEHTFDHASKKTALVHSIVPMLEKESLLWVHRRRFPRCDFEGEMVEVVDTTDQTGVANCSGGNGGVLTN